MIFTVGDTMHPVKCVWDLLVAIAVDLTKGVGKLSVGPNINFRFCEPYKVSVVSLFYFVPGIEPKVSCILKADFNISTFFCLRK